MKLPQLGDIVLVASKDPDFVVGVAHVTEVHDEDSPEEGILGWIAATVVATPRMDARVFGGLYVFATPEDGYKAAESRDLPHFAYLRPAPDAKTPDVKAPKDKTS